MSATPRSTFGLDRSQAVMIGVAAAMLTVFVCLVWVPDARVLSRMRSDLSAAELELNGRMAEVELLPEVAKKVARMKVQYLSDLTRVPGESDMAQFLETVADVLRQEQIEQRELVPGQPTADANVTQLPIRLTFEAKFEAAMRVICRLEALERLNHVESLKLVSPPESPGQLRVEMELVTYRSDVKVDSATQVAAVGREVGR